MRFLYLEPFCAGSHAQFTTTLTEGVSADWTAVTLPGRHWKWRMRGAAVYLAQDRREQLAGRFDLLMASSFVNLADLLALVPHLAPVPSILYFHENQLAYPVREERPSERDAHFGLTQLVSALVATRCWFNSRFNLESFVSGGAGLLARMPDAVPSGWIEDIAAKSEVVPIPLRLPVLAADPSETGGSDRELGPVILWNHRWEHDKDPDAFFDALQALVDRAVPFRVIVCGERFRRAPPVFARARRDLGQRVLHWGTAGERAAYWRLLERAHIAVSTARHEFFGVAMLEAAWAGAYPLVPDRLAYPEHFPDEHRYASHDQLIDRLERLCRAFCGGEETLRADRRHLAAPFEASRQLPELARRLNELAAGGRSG